MMRRGTGLAALAAVLASAPAAAQQPGTLEIGAFGRYTAYGDEIAGLRLDNAIGGGLRIGYFFSPILGLEADAAYARPESRALTVQNPSHVPIHLRALVNFPLSDRTTVLMGFGGVIDKYARGYDINGKGIGALAGVRLGLARTLALRLDATWDRILAPESNTARYTNWGLQAGVSALFGVAAGVSGSGDTDGDGVVNSADRCPGSPPGSAVDGTGCTARADTDRDGVIDINDICPGTPAGDRVDVNGCSGNEPREAPAAAAPPVQAAPADADGDGVPDTADRCAATPAGERVDAAGCTVPRDTDGDGVMDPDDRCPSSAPGTTVDAKGCVALFEADRPTAVLQGVTFETGSAELTREASTSLMHVAAALRADPGVRVEVGGHTDNVGRRAANLALSEARAAAVRDYLIGSGIPAERVTARGYGTAQPVAPNTSEEGRALNRRVELRRID
jgi:OOP family OmpA-OmpF porin